MSHLLTIGLSLLILAAAIGGCGGAAEKPAGKTPETHARPPHVEPPPIEMRIRVIALQFTWVFQLPGRDGEFGNINLKPDLISTDLAQLVGLSREGSGRDDVMSTVLVLPQNSQVRCKLVTMDVPHRMTIVELGIDALVKRNKPNTITFSVNHQPPVLSPSDRRAHRLILRAKDDHARMEFKYSHLPVRLACGTNCGPGAERHVAPLYIVSQHDWEH